MGFSALHDALVARFGANLPIDLPAKTLIRTFDPVELEERKHALNAYLKALSGLRTCLEVQEVQMFFDPSCSAPYSAPAPGGVPPPIQTGSSSVVGAPPRQDLRRQVNTHVRTDDEDDLIGWDG